MWGPAHPVGAPSGRTQDGVKIAARCGWPPSFVPNFCLACREQLRLIGSIRGKDLVLRVAGLPGSWHLPCRLHPGRQICSNHWYASRRRSGCGTLSSWSCPGAARRGKLRGGAVRKIENYDQAVLMRIPLPQESANSAAIRRRYPSALCSRGRGSGSPRCCQTTASGLFPGAGRCLTQVRKPGRRPWSSSSPESSGSHSRA